MEFLFIILGLLAAFSINRQHPATYIYAMTFLCSLCFVLATVLQIAKINIGG